jgi:hypothetical protein
MSEEEKITNDLVTALNNANKALEKAKLLKDVNSKLTSIILELHNNPIFTETINDLMKTNGLTINDM